MTIVGFRKSEEEGNKDNGGKGGIEEKMNVQGGVSGDYEEGGEWMRKERGFGKRANRRKRKERGRTEEWVHELRECAGKEGWDGKGSSWV